MKFAYSYKTSDNVTHEDVVEAPNRSQAYAVLKKMGRRPIKVEPVPGEVARRRALRLMCVVGVLVVVAVMCITAIKLVKPSAPSPEYVSLAARAEAISAKALDAAAGSPVGAAKVIEDAQQELKNLFRTEYPKLVNDSESTRLKAQALYGKLMMILTDEREFCRDPQQRKGTDPEK